MLSIGLIIIQWINDIYFAINQIVIYLVDSVIHPLNNWVYMYT